MIYPKGPWVEGASISSREREIKDANGNLICTVHEANARLIAKAPDMAELLKKIKDVIEYDWVQKEIGELLSSIEGE